MNQSLTTKLPLILGLMPFLPASSAEPVAASQKPNIVYMIADDLGVGDLQCYGAAKIQTPHLDRLASQGIRATEAFASAAVCTPSRYGILTGRDFWKVRNRWEGQSLIEADRRTVAKTLRDAGYATAYFGKWHLGWGGVVQNAPRKHRSDMDWNVENLGAGALEAGFDTFFGTPFSHNEPPLVFVEDRKVYQRDPSDPLVVVGPEIEKYYGYGTSRGAEAAHKARPVERIDEIVAERAANFIARNASRPFYINVAFVSPHVPIAPAPEFRGKSQAKAYGDYVQMLDHCAGLVLQALDKAGVTDNTLVIFTSDNGAILHKDVHATGHRANAARLGQKTDAWLGGVNVPFIARWPARIPAGSTTEALISLNDFYATACAAAGLPAPEGGGIDSINQLPVLENPSAPSLRKEMTFIAISPPGIALRSGDWLFIPGQGSLGVTTNPQMAWAMQFGEAGFVNSDFSPDGTLHPDAPPVQLYNVSDDPAQAVNLAAQHPEKAEELAARLHLLEKAR